MLRASLITLGDPQRLTGGYLYHRRMAAAAGAYDATLRFVSCRELVFPVGACPARRALTDAAEGTDVVVVDSIAAWMLAPWVRRNAAPPLVVMSHQVPGGIDHGPVRSWCQARLDVWTYRRARLLMVASETLADDLRSRGFPPEIVRVVAPGRDPAVPSGPPPDLRAGRRAAVLCVGNWVPRKGIVALLDAFARLPHGSATLHLVGEEHLVPRYERQVLDRLRDPALHDRVVRHGPIPAARVAAMYEAADVFALPSTTEPYGTVIGEAIAAGVPVVGWDAGNLPHLAAHGVEGLVVPVGDVSALAVALRRLTEDEEYRGALAAGARRRGAALPTWDDTAQMFYDGLRDAAAA